MDIPENWQGCINTAMKLMLPPQVLAHDLGIDLPKEGTATNLVKAENAEGAITNIQIACMFNDLETAYQVLEDAIKEFGKNSSTCALLRKWAVNLEFRDLADEAVKKMLTKKPPENWQECLIFAKAAELPPQEIAHVFGVALPEEGARSNIVKATSFKDAITNLRMVCSVNDLETACSILEDALKNFSHDREEFSTIRKWAVNLGFRDLATEALKKMILVM